MSVGRLGDEFVMCWCSSTQTVDVDSAHTGSEADGQKGSASCRGTAHHSVNEIGIPIITEESNMLHQRIAWNPHKGGGDIRVDDLQISRGEVVYRLRVIATMSSSLQET